MVLLLKNKSLSIQIAEVKKVKKQGLGVCPEEPNSSRMARFFESHADLTALAESGHMTAARPNGKYLSCLPLVLTSHYSSESSSGSS